MSNYVIRLLFFQLTFKKFCWEETVLHKSKKWFPIFNISAHSKYFFFFAVYVDRALSAKFHHRENFFYLSYKALDSGVERTGWEERKTVTTWKHMPKPPTYLHHRPVSAEMSG